MFSQRIIHKKISKEKRHLKKKGVSILRNSLGGAGKMALWVNTLAAQAQ